MPAPASAWAVLGARVQGELGRRQLSPDRMRLGAETRGQDPSLAGGGLAQPRWSLASLGVSLSPLVCCHFPVLSSGVGEMVMKAQSRVPVIGHSRSGHCVPGRFPWPPCGQPHGDGPAPGNGCPPWPQVQPEQGWSSGEGPALMPTCVPALRPRTSFPRPPSQQARVRVPGARRGRHGAHVADPAEQARPPVPWLARVWRARRVSPVYGEASGGSLL